VRKLLIASIVTLAVASPTLAQAPSPAIAAAIDEVSRPTEDKARDPMRKPADMLAFGMVAPGKKVGEILPGGGYFTRLFSKTVGDNGRVYAILAPPPPPAPGAPEPKAAPVAQVAAEPGFGNIRVVTTPFDKITVPEKLDLVWTSQNYHDLHNRPGLSLTSVNRAVYNALKPGGYYVVLDHVGPVGSGKSATNTTHRIDPALVKMEVTSVGFVFDGESTVLRNPQDDHTKRVFDPTLRGETDQFVYRFRKPQ